MPITRGCGKLTEEELLARAEQAVDTMEEQHNRRDGLLAGTKDEKLRDEFRDAYLPFLLHKYELVDTEKSSE